MLGNNCVGELKRILRNKNISRQTKIRKTIQDSGNTSSDIRQGNVRVIQRGEHSKRCNGTKVKVLKTYSADAKDNTNNGNGTNNWG